MAAFELFAHQLNWPTDWAQVYGRAAPLLVEIGFGGGHFLVELARQRPSANILGVEIALPAIRRARQKLTVAGVSNARLIQSSAEYLLWAGCAPHTISDVFINFPDPWPKGDQQHRRLVDGRFLELLATRLLPGGRLNIATDHAEYAAAIADCLERSPHFAALPPASFTARDEQRPRTKYEQIALDAGRPCHYFKWQRNDAPSPPGFAVPQEIPMPHVILQSSLHPADIAGHFTPQQFAAGDLHVRLRMMFQAQAGELLLVQVYVHEAPLSQHVGLLIRRRETGHYLIGLAEIGFPRPTPGLQLAIGSLARWLLSLDAGAVVIQHNLPAELFNP